MTHTNQSYIKYAINRIVESIQEGGNSTKITSYWNNFNGEKVSYLGFNFSENKITSVKIYFVVYTNTILKSEFPIPELYYLFLKNIQTASPHITEKFSTGGGITFSIKVKLGTNSLEYGYYLRCNELSSEEKETITLDKIPFNIKLLPQSWGVYNTLENAETRLAIYAYTNPIDLFPTIQHDNIHFQDIRGVEIAKLNNPQDLKYIYIGGDTLFKDSLIKQIPEELIAFKNTFSLNLVCPAFNQQHKLCSVYLTDFSNHSILPSLQCLNTYEQG